MRKCPNCGQKTVSTSDWACPWCGYTLLSASYGRMTKTYKELKEEKQYKQKYRSEGEPVPTEIEITAEEMYSAYTVDKVAADKRFRNKMLTITGMVVKTVVDIDDAIYYITLARTEQQEQWKIHCLFDRRYEPQLDQLTAGQRVTVHGKYDGATINIRMKDCIIVNQTA